MYDVNFEFIDSNLTQTVYGYLPTNLSKGSHKRVVAICEFCNNSFHAVFKNLRRNNPAIVCLRCSNLSRKYFSEKSCMNRHEYWKCHNSFADTSRINVTISKEKFGYDQIDVSLKSRKRVVVNCEFCNNDFVTCLSSLHKNGKNTCCRQCVSISILFGRQKVITDKHIFYEYILEKRKNSNKSSIDLKIPSSNKKIEVKCEFCFGTYTRAIKYISNQFHSACNKCVGIRSAFLKQKSITNKHEFWLSRVPKIDLSMIDVDGTLNKFGYDPRNISMCSNKKILVKCCFCGTTTDAKFSYFVKSESRKTCKACKYKKNIETIRKRYGVSSVLEIPGVMNKSNDPITERIIESMLRDTFKIDYMRHYEVKIDENKSYEFDFFLPSINLLIECHGDYFHDFKRNGYSGTPRDRGKSSFIENNTSYKLVWVWEHEIHIGRLNKILGYHIHNAVEPEVVIDSNKLIEFKRIEDRDAHLFLSQYHYLGNLGTISTCYGGFFKDELICVCTFGGTTRQNTFKKVKNATGNAFGTKQLKELRRFCLKPNVKAKRLASFAIRKFVELFVKDFPNTKAIISFSDPTVRDVGNIYKYAGWTRLKDTGKSYHYIDSVTCKMIHKRTVWDLAKQAHMSENDFADRSNLVKILEESKSSWIKIF